MPLLLDLETWACGQTDPVLDGLYKAISDPPDAEAIWTPHQDPWIRGLIEDWTDRGLNRLRAIQTALLNKIDPKRPLEPPLRKGTPPWQKWDAEEMARVQFALDRKARADYTLDDWLTLIDLLIQTYWPDGVIQSEADYLAIRAHFAGQLKANLETLPSAAQLKAAQIARLAALLPATFANIPPEILTERDAHILRFAAAQTANLITNLTATTRARMKTVILDGIKRITLGDRQGTWQKLGQELFDTFGDLNRDWRRIAITETGNATNTGYLSSLPIGTKVRREEAYRGACPFCQKIRGKILTVVSDEQEPKDWETEVWPGKTNVGRSASPRKRVGGLLMPRTPDELWSIPAGVVHPHCFISPQVPIYTSAGWKPIGKISIGDQVLTHQGRFKPVYWTLNNPVYTGNVIKLTVAFNEKNAIPLSAMTPEHPILTDSGWVSAEDLKTGDLLISLAKTCPTCGDAFINLKHRHVLYCSVKCFPRPGKNQFSTDSPQQYADAVLKTSIKNRQRMRHLTIEQRQQLTEKGREVMAQRGYAHLAPAAIHRKGNRAAARINYAPNEAEQQIAERLHQLGQSAELQYRTPQLTPDCLGRRRYWFLDLALPDQKIAVEIDGDYWHPRQRDEERDADLQQQGWTVLRFDRKAAHQRPEKLADEICRLAMNHSQEYRFSAVQITRIQTQSVKQARLYNFGVEEDESYIINGGIVVHNCRGSWSRVASAPPGMSNEYQMWLRGLLINAGLPASPGERR